MLQIKQSVSMSRLGKRTHNEDAVYPFLPDSGINEEMLQHVPDVPQLYMVCDGVGGSSKGEVASQLACMTFPQYFVNFPPETEGAFSATYLENALQYVEKTFDQYMERHPESRGMGTTFTLFYANEKGINLAWAGDSRIYHFRKGLKLYQSEDHSLVNYLIKLGQITPEEARTHKQKNVILRAVQGSHAPTQCDTHFIPWNKIEYNDYFILCSDGILEGVDNYELERLMGLGLEPHSLVHEIELLCQNHSKDNYSCYLLQMGESLGMTSQEAPVYAVPSLNLGEGIEAEEGETIILQQPPLVTTPTAQIQPQTPTLLQRLQNESTTTTSVEATPQPIVAAPPKKALIGEAAIEAIEAPQEAGSGMSWWILGLVLLAIAGGIGYWYFLGRTQFQNSGYEQAIREAKTLQETGRLDEALDWAEKARLITDISEAEALDASALIQKINEEKSVLRDSARSTYTKEKIGPGTPHEVKPVSPPPTTNEPSIKDQNKPIIEKPKT
ncbi:MAG: protein phosphatase 2C domain-containing protein, partial [Bacteroidia bacterium]